MAKTWIITLAAFLFVIMIYGLIQGTITGNLIKNDPKTIIYFPNVADFPNEKEGTVTFDLGFPGEFKVGNQTADAVMFLNSIKVPGLRIGYDIKDRRIIAGLPVLITKPIIFLDGKNHKLVYTFDKEQKKQSVYLDGEMLASGEFDDSVSVDLTGYSIYQRSTWIKADHELITRFD